ncbi:MAG: Gfo/Idh/MocA family protein [Propionibacteriaceae bacterium]
MSTLSRAAVVGCGDVSVVHLAAIAEASDIELVAVCDTDPTTAATAAGHLGVPAYGDHRQLLAAVAPDVVHVCTPHHQHVPVVLDCLAAGVDVITEKPLAATMAEAEKIIAAAAAHPNTKIGVCFQNRYNTTSEAMRALLDSGELGAVQGAAATVLWHRTAAYYQAKPWRGRIAESGGGVLINQAVHTLDLLQWLLGEVTDVAGRAGTYGLGNVIEVEDTAQLVLTHHTGVRSVCFATLLHATDAPVTLEIVTEHATLRLAGDLRITWSDGRTETVAEPVATGGGRSYWGASHTRLITDFYRRRSDPEPFWLGPHEAVKSLRILTDLYALGR